MTGDTVTLTVREGDKKMATNEGDFPRYSEMANVQGSMSILLQGNAAASVRRTDRADQISADSSAMWSIAMTSPTVMAAHGMKVASEMGSGRSRVEANSPASSQATGG
tara:strand:- start:116 stop:439 length:324 start_codon:yes stop_codon:yes gene_type:complete